MADSLESLKARWEQHRNPSHVAECAAGDALLAAVEQATKDERLEVANADRLQDERDEARRLAETWRLLAWCLGARCASDPPFPWERPTEGA